MPASSIFTSRKGTDRHVIITVESLLSISGKIQVLLNCLNNHLKHRLLLESQCGLCKECGTVDMVFAAREVLGTEHWPLLDLS